jgi:hypothetical protein
MQEKPEGFAAWAEARSAFARTLTALALVLAGTASLVAGNVVTWSGGWSSWAVRLLLLEPLGIAAVLAGGMVAWPRSRLSVYVSSALAQRRYASAAGVIVALGVVLELFRWFARQAVLSRVR